MDHLETIARDLLVPLWKGISGEYKQKYSTSIWTQFENNIRSAAYTSSLSKFLNDICAKLGIEIKKDDVARVSKMLESRSDKEILRTLRDETTTLVLLVRVENEEKRKK